MTTPKPREFRLYRLADELRELSTPIGKEAATILERQASTLVMLHADLAAREAELARYKATEGDEIVRELGAIYKWCSPQYGDPMKKAAARIVADAVKLAAKDAELAAMKQRAVNKTSARTSWELWEDPEVKDDDLFVPAIDLAARDAELKQARDSESDLLGKLLAAEQRAEAAERKAEEAARDAERILPVPVSVGAVRVFAGCKVATAILAINRAIDAAIAAKGEA